MEIILIEKLLQFILGGCIFTFGYKIFFKNKQKLATGKLGKLKDIETIKGTDGFIISKNFQLNFKKSCENVVVIAPPGEGKTVSLFAPNLLSNHFPKSSLIIPDPKGQLWELTNNYQRSIGRKPILFEPLGKQGHYNPLEHCKSFTEVRQLAVNILENAQLVAGNGESKSGDWISMSTPLLTAALLHEKTIPKALDLIITNTEEELEEKFASSTIEAKKQFLIFKSSMRSDKTVDSIRTTLTTSMALYCDPDIIKTVSSSDFSPEQLRKEPIALYIKYDSAKSKYLSPFLGIFYTQLIEKIMYSYKENLLPVIFFMEELQNCGKIQGLEMILAICRDYLMPFMCCLQNTSKLQDIYGKNNAMTILNCLKTKCILPSLSDIETLRYISELCGETEIKVVNSKGNDNKTTRKLFTIDEVRRLSIDNTNSDGKILIIAHNKLPLIDHQNFYYKQEKYLKNVI